MANIPHPKTLSDIDEDLWQLSKAMAKREKLPQWKWVMIAVADSIIDAGSPAQKKLANKRKSELMK